MTAVFLAKMAPSKLKAVVSSAVSLLAGIPSVVYGLVGMLVLVPGIRQVFHIPDGSGLLAAIIVLAIMILPSIINVAMTALEAVPREYEEASLALGAAEMETYFRVSLHAARSGIAAAVVLGVFFYAEYLRKPYCYIDGVAIYDKEAAMQATVYLQGLSDFGDQVRMVDELIINE